MLTTYLKWIVAAGAVAFCAGWALAQQPADRQVIVRRAPAGVGSGVGSVISAEGNVAMQGPGMMRWIGPPMGFETQVVTGAPYSAEAVTETVRTLGDGNRIVNRSTSNVYRDGQGRTRREHRMENLGPWAAGEPRESVVIDDPVAGATYILDPTAKTVTRMTRISIEDSGPDGGDVLIRRGHAVAGAAVAGPRADVTVMFNRRVPGPAEGGVPAPPMGATFLHRQVFPGGEPKTEPLGKQMIEGVEAEGTRTTTVIPEGAIGNERPIEIVHESWHSPDLKQVVLSRHTDPQMGETTYRLTRIVRAEPMASLFEVPGDYTVQENREVQFLRRLEKPAGQDAPPPLP